MVVTSAPSLARRASRQVHLSTGLVRTELDRLGMHYIADVQATEHRMLEALDGEERTAFAAAVAERLLRWHEIRPPKERQAYPCAWRATLDVIWAGLSGDAAAFSEVSRLIAEFYLSPYHHGDGVDGPADATDDAVAATLYAAQCYLYGCVDFAMWSAACGYDAAAAVAAADESWAHRRPAELNSHTWQLAHPALQLRLH